jgi:hypothetical protein
VTITAFWTVPSTLTLLRKIAELSAVPGRCTWRRWSCLTFAAVIPVAAPVALVRCGFSPNSGQSPSGAAALARLALATWPVAMTCAVVWAGASPGERTATMVAAAAHSAAVPAITRRLTVLIPSKASV